MFTSPALFSSPPRHTHSPLPPTSVSLSHTLTLLSLFLSLTLCLSLPKLAQLSISPPAVPPAACPHPNEKPHNNTGHRSRERTGCVHNGPVAPSKTIVPFFSGTLPPLLPGLEKTNLWRGGRMGSGGGIRGGGTFPSTYNCVKTHSDKTLQHTLALSVFTLPPRFFVRFKSHHAL